MEEKYCIRCDGELDGSEFYDDMCDECAKADGLLDDEDGDE